MSQTSARTLAVWLLMCGIAPNFCGSVQCEPEPPAAHIFLSGKEQLVVGDAVRGAVLRLARPECQRLFTIFTDSAGHTLSANLEAQGNSSSEYLAGLYFVDGDDSARCRLDEGTAAFTTPGSRVIYVCGARFANRFARNTTGGEILIIHELLHSLGLGENPPTSAEITNLVMARCGN